jgi:hypothetical protein
MISIEVNPQDRVMTHKETDADGPLFQVRLGCLDGWNISFYRNLLEAMREKLPRELVDELYLKAFCETVILPDTWQTFVDGKPVDGIEDPLTGKLIPATAENCLFVLQQLPELADRLLAKSIEFNHLAHN